jgi:hypothetical protein
LAPSRYFSSTVLEPRTNAFASRFELVTLYVAQETSTFYSRKAVVWIQADSCPDYMLKSEECLKNEKERVKHYLHPSSEPKLLQEAERELLATHETVRLSPTNTLWKHGKPFAPERCPLRSYLVHAS